MRSLLKLSIAGLTAAGADATRYTDSSFHRLQQQLSPAPGDILENLDQYDKLWIEVRSPSTSKRRGSCVWSECGIDETDDAYMGDYRDGDEKWYQYRTQNFCANAAYSLYGHKKDEFGWASKWSGCSRKHFINSFFTYGGADNLLKAIGVTPVSYYAGDDDDNNGNDDAADDDAADDDAADDDSNKVSNSNCVEIDYDWDDDNEQENDGEDGNRKDRRRLSGSQDNDGFGSSLGCSSEGDYIMGVFKSSSCDGNYFLEAIDTFDEYNAQHSSVGCHNIWKSRDEATYDNIYALLSNSWSCDVKLYPYACPDPFGEKGRYEYAIRTAAHGGNPMWALRNMTLKRPLRILSFFLLGLTCCILVLTYIIKKSKQIKANGGGVSGLLRSLKKDTVASVLNCWALASAAIFACWAWILQATGKAGDDSVQQSQSSTPRRFKKLGRVKGTKRKKVRASGMKSEADPDCVFA